jgi:hypothetical protein
VSAMARTLGMPSFANGLSSDQVCLIQAYVLDQARLASPASGPAAGGH